LISLALTGCGGGGDLLPLFPVAVTDDGRTIQANATQADPSGTAHTVHTFTFTALKE